MITTNKRTIGLCNMCHERKALAALTGTLVGLCHACYDEAGDENAVSDGHMTCADFQSRYGKHSEYCDCKAQASTTDDGTDAALAAYIASRVALTEAHSALMGLTKVPGMSRGYVFEAEASARALRTVITAQDEDACRIFGKSAVVDALMAAISARQ
jgi:hypothetical protein